MRRKGWREIFGYENRFAGERSLERDHERLTIKGGPWESFLGGTVKRFEGMKGDGRSSEGYLRDQMGRNRGWREFSGYGSRLWGGISRDWTEGGSCDTRPLRNSEWCAGPGVKVT